MHTLKILPAARAGEIVAAAARRIGEHRIHPPVGADEVRRAKAKLFSAIVGVCIWVGLFVMGSVLLDVAERREANDQAHGPLSKGTCLDYQALKIPCTSDAAMYVVLGDRNMARCPRSSPAIIDALAVMKADTRKLSRWCIHLNRLTRAR